ncbi:MAG: AraC family transcriptional regulator [Ruminococcaceae bacterium]|nr:AraC family transcriptional regulator [Oscillospiraceae bacterium]
MQENESKMKIAEENLEYNHAVITCAKGHPRFSMKHSHNAYEIIFFEHGDAEYIVENRYYKLRKNDLVFTRPSEYHFIKIHSDAEYSRFNILFDSDFIDENIINLIPPQIEAINCPKSSIIAENFKRMKYYGEHFSKEDFTVLLQSLLKEILYNLSISEADVINLPSEVSPLITRALDYINENLFTVKELQEICDELSVSKPYLFKLFNDQLKISPKRYINLKRLNYAKKLIQQGRRPTEVCFECGFDSYVGFYKQYVKQFGCPPSHKG